MPPKFQTPFLTRVPASGRESRTVEVETPQSRKGVAAERCPHADSRELRSCAHSIPVFFGNLLCQGELDRVKDLNRSCDGQPESIRVVRGARVTLPGLSSPSSPPKGDSAGKVPIPPDGACCLRARVP